MDYISGIQRAVDYIEEHISDDIDIADIAREAACSPFYFQRIFGLLCGMPIGEYIRNRRLTLAGSELSSTDIRVIDAALKYGYDSPESFTRAFQRFHGITPSEAKRGGKLRSFSRVSVQISLKGGSIMDYRIVKKDAFKVLEKVERHSIDDSANKNTIPEFWTRSWADGMVGKLLEQTPDRAFIFGICYNNEHTDNSRTFDYGIAALYGGGDVPDGYRVTEIPSRTWAVFECRGAMPDAIQKTWHDICTEFMPASGYTPTYEMDIEAYTAGNMADKLYYSEVWVPVEAK